MTIEKRKGFIINVVYFALIIAIVYIVIKYALGLLLPFLVGFFVAFLLKPAINFVSKKLHVPRKAVAVISVCLFYGAVGFFLSWSCARLLSGLKDIIIKLPEMYKANLEPAINEFFQNIEGIIDRFDPLLGQSTQDIASSFAQSVGAAISGISSEVILFLSSTVPFIPILLLTIIISVISSVFIAVDYSKITGSIVRFFPSRNRHLFYEAKAFATDIGLKYVKAYAALMFVTFLELSIGLSLLKVEAAVTIAVLIAVIDILPVFGTGAVLIPWIVIELIKGSPSFAAGLTVLYLVIIIIRNILEPKLVGKQIGLHPLIMLICMYAGAKIFGFIGLFALPILAVVVKHLYDIGQLHFSNGID